MSDIGFGIAYIVGEIVAILTEVVVLVGAVVYAMFRRKNAGNG